MNRNKVDEIFPLVSVVMITYAHENYIKQAIQGVLIQEYQGEIELIIANDKSPDKTDEVVRKIIDEHPNGSWIKYTSHEKNLGMMPNFIWALQQAKGKYIALCEGDDYWTNPLKLQKQVGFLEEHNEVVVCGTNYNVLAGEKLIIRDRFTTLGLFGHYDIFKDNKVGTLTSLFRNNFVLPEYFSRCNFGDMILLLELTKNGGKIAIFPFNSAVYRIHDGGVFSGASELNNIKRGTADLLLFFENNYWKKKYIRIVLNVYSKKAIKHLIRALLRRPNSDIRFFIVVTKFVFRSLFVLLRF